MMNRFNRDYFDFDLFDDVFDPFFSPRRNTRGTRSLQAPAGRAQHAPASMRTDIEKVEGGYELSTELAGFGKDDISVEIRNGYLTITAEKKTEKNEDEGKNYIHRERYYGKSQRSFYVGNNVNEDDIKATFADGILKLTIPEPKEQVKKTIAIE